MSDDGLIVLRTVRNLLAGNGPVFNAGERIEANTSTLWQYLITAVAWVTGGRLEDIATALALHLLITEPGWAAVGVVAKLALIWILALIGTAANAYLMAGSRRRAEVETEEEP